MGCTPTKATLYGCCTCTPHGTHGTRLSINKCYVAKIYKSAVIIIVKALALLIPRDAHMQQPQSMAVVLSCPVETAILDCLLCNKGLQGTVIIFINALWLLIPWDAHMQYPQYIYDYRPCTSHGTNNTRLSIMHSRCIRA